MREYTEQQIRDALDKIASKYSARVTGLTLHQFNTMRYDDEHTDVHKALTELKDQLIRSNWNAYLGCSDSTIHVNLREKKRRCVCKKK